MALAQQFTPPLSRLALEITTGPGRDWPLAIRIIGNTAVPRIAARLLNAVSFMLVFLFVRSGTTASRTRDDGKDFQLCHRESGRSHSDLILVARLILQRQSCAKGFVYVGHHGTIA